ncbi:MAG: hypothetical protein L6R42_003059 [Xanthoria sp. 1 TBL-2021]|nr:MAG: hypothetical protein L6R42_003059 [Xanthoria sp. 1 TBL-2021]
MAQRTTNYTDDHAGSDCSVYAMQQYGPAHDKLSMALGDFSDAKSDLPQAGHTAGKTGVTTLWRVERTAGQPMSLSRTSTRVFLRRWQGWPTQQPSRDVDCESRRPEEENQFEVRITSYRVANLPEISFISRDEHSHGLKYCFVAVLDNSV